MNWFTYIIMALLSGALGMVCGGCIMSRCVGWYRVSSFEGNSGYAIIGVALLGGIGGLLIGLMAAWVVASGSDPGFLKGLGYGAGAVLAVSLVALAICRIFADIAPTIDGKPLQLAIEIRFPKGSELPEAVDAGGYKPSAEVYVPHGRRMPSAGLRLAEAVRVEGQWVVPTTVPLTTGSTSKFLSVRLNATTTLLFNLPLRPRPDRRDMQWGKWVESAWDATKPEPPKEEKFNARYRILVAGEVGQGGDQREDSQ